MFVPLPTSPLHYFVTKVSARGIVFELVRLARVPMEGGVGTKLVIGDRSPMDLSRLRDRRIKREQGESVILTSGLQEELPFGSFSYLGDRMTDALLQLSDRKAGSQ